MKRISTHLLLTGCSIAALLNAAKIANAQEAQQTANAPGTDSSLEEVVVTAERFSTDLQKTPVAVTSLDAQSLQEHGVTNILDLNSIAPNVSIAPRSGTGATSGDIVIRGIGFDAQSPASPAVGIYVDDVYLPASYGNLLGLYDVADVEILRGPQGTLFGRNTIGGALQYSSVRPTLGQTDGFVDTTLGNFDHHDFDAGINIPLGDIAALRVSGGYREIDGYVHDILKDVNRGSDENKDLRVQLRIRPSDALTIDLKGEYASDDSNGPASIPIAFNYNTVFGALYGPFGPFGPAGLDKYISTGLYETAGEDGPTFFKSNLKILQGTVTYNISDNLTAKFISAFIDDRAHLAEDQDATPLQILNISKGQDDDELYTEELQLYGKSFDQRLHWTLGAYYYNDDSSDLDQIAVAFGMPSNPYGNYSILTESEAVYGQATYNITDQFAVVGGMRYTNESVKSNDQVSGSNDKTFTNASPLGGLNFQATDDLLLYAKWSRGFRAGAFSPNVGGSFYFRPELASTWEVGSRMEFFDHRLRINPSLFQTTWKDIQFNESVIVPAAPFPLPIVANAGDSDLKGAELEAQAKVTSAFSLHGSLSYLDAHYTKVDSVNGGAPVVSLNSPLAHAPDVQFTIGGRYDWDFADGSDVSLSLNYAWQDNQRSSTSDADFVEQPAYGLLNGRLEYLAPDGKWSVALYSNNITGEKYLTGGTDFGKGGTIPGTLAEVGRPREYGISAKFNFAVPEEASAAEPPPPPPPAAVAPAPVPTLEAARQFQVFFDFDKSNITSAAAQVIQAAADAVKAGNIVHITVTGHTDTVGSARYNQALSERRAASVKTQMVSDGVAGGDITTVGVGKSGLLVPTKDGVREPQNRRAVIELQ